MTSHTVGERILHEHSEIQQRLADWEAAVRELSAPSFIESQQGLQRLWRLVPYFEKELPRHFREEESDLFTEVGASVPGSTPALIRFSSEHAQLSRQWQAYKCELLYSDAVGQTARLREISVALIRTLRQHMQDEERELLPLTSRN